MEGTVMLFSVARQVGGDAGDEEERGEEGSEAAAGTRLAGDMEGKRRRSGGENERRGGCGCCFSGVVVWLAGDEKERNEVRWWSIGVGGLPVGGSGVRRQDCWCWTDKGDREERWRVCSPEKTREGRKERGMRRLRLRGGKMK
ncbi:hypothetical protein HAX54_037388 [Datura stramonium]|uniref:Uncharacterized protein n=1 Tax=Datura stramonium TaxID=4076 RepID=A0ABS8VJ07_DATST|nr:hypothetical protein [Datura stramonium]